MLSAPAAGVYLNRRYEMAPPARPWLVGAVSTAIGLTVGIGAVALASALKIVRSEILFYVLLAPIRMVEWLALVAIFFERPWKSWRRALGSAAQGSLWSFALDIPAAMAIFVLPGGVWVC